MQKLSTEYRRLTHEREWRVGVFLSRLFKLPLIEHRSVDYEFSDYDLFLSDGPRIMLVEVKWRFDDYPSLFMKEDKINGLLREAERLTAFPVMVWRTESFGDQLWMRHVSHSDFVQFDIVEMSENNPRDKHDENMRGINYPKDYLQRIR